MNALEARAEAKKFSKEMGPQGDCYISLNFNDWSEDRKALNLSAYADGHGRLGGQPQGITFSVEGDSFEELFANARAMWAERQAEFIGKKIRRMALDIIRMTADLGTCTDAGLRAEGHTAEDIARYGADAMKDADTIAANGPFKITVMEKANAA